MITTPFHIADIEMFLPGGSASTTDYTLGAAPIGALSLNPEPVESSGTLRVSDHGYRTRHDDPDGVVVYPPLIRAGFAIDRALNLSPHAVAATWSFGSIVIYDDGSISSLMRAWNIDAQTITIRRGLKETEDFHGHRSVRSTKGWYFSVAGVLTEAAAETVRWNYETGSPVMMDEAASTNHVANPRAEGAVAATPGTSPTSWTISGAISGLTRSIVGIGTENGIPYIDVRWAGTASATVNVNIQPVSTTAVAAAVGQTWTASSWVKLAGGSLTGMVFARLSLGERGGATEPSTALVYIPTTSGLSTQFKQVSRTLTISDTAYVQLLHQFQFSNGAVVDVTFRIGGPQLEQAAAATSLILPAVGTPAVTARDAEKLYTARGTWVSPPVGDLETVFVGMAGPWFADEGQVTIPIRDVTYWLERPVQTAVYDGTGTVGGTANMVGVPLPITRGTVYNIEPLLIDPTNRIYQWSDGAGTILALYERGATGITFDANTTNLWTGSTAAGKYRTDVARSLFQLGSTPVGQITIDATGEFPTAGNKTVWADIARYLLSETVAVPSAFIDTASFSAAATDYPYGAGIHVASNSGMSGLEAVSVLMEGAGAKLYAGRDGQLRALALRAIADDETVVAALGPQNIREVNALRLPDDLATPVWRVRVGHKRNHTIQPDVSSSATAAHRQEVAAAAQYVTWSSETVRASYRRPNDLAPIGGALTDSADAQDVADGLGALWGVSRSLFAVEVPISVGLPLEFGVVVSIEYPLDILAAGARGRVVKELYRSAEWITLGVLV